MSPFIMPLIGGALIGLSATLMLLFNGRITGISSIVNNSMKLDALKNIWRLFFILGLLIGGFILRLTHPQSFSFYEGRSHLQIAIAGLLVGFGTVLANGCTSGHGVCGLSRLSLRSLIATFIFIGFGVLTVFILGRVF